MSDFRLALRQVARAPGFAALVIVTLGLGIGANTALFSVVNGVLLRPLPYPHPGRLVAIYSHTRKIGHAPSNYPNFLDWRREAHSFASMAMYRHADRLLTGAGQAEQVSGLQVSANFLATLGVRPVAGRDFSAADDHRGAAPVAMLGGGFWRQRFGGSRAILGRVLDLDGLPRTVIGILPARFRFYGLSPDVYTPIGQYKDASFRDRSVDESAQVIGRLKPGVTLAQAQAEMSGIARQLAREYPHDEEGGIALVSLRRDLVGHVQPFLWLLLGAVGLLLLIACVNVASLLLARARDRETELAVRAALGAGQGRLLRQRLSESLVLSALGGVLGLALAWVARRGVLALLPAGLPRGNDIRLDGPVLAFTIAVALLAGLASGCVPALRGMRADGQLLLRAAGHGVAGRRDLQAIFAAGEIALALILLVGAGLLLRTMAALGRVDPGYNPRHAITFDLALPARPGIPAAETRARIRAFDAAVGRLPGVVAESATLGSRPMIHDSSLPFWIEGRPKPANQNAMPQALFYLAEGGYARAMGLKLLRGRFLTNADDEHAPAVVVIDSVFARRFFPGRNPVGRRIHLAGFDVAATIVGVVGHVREWGLRPDPGNAIEAELFYPFMQLPAKLMPMVAGGTAVIVRTRGNFDALVAPMRAAVRRLDPREVVYRTQTMSGILDTSVAAEDSTLRLLALFGGLALLLAAIGTYGVIACYVASRTREVGIRMALGGGRRAILRLVLGGALRIAFAGVVAGVIGAALLTRAMASMLYGVSPTDPLTYAAVAAGMVAVALAAAYVPARRALRIDPCVALRAE
jgi:predicted permease